ncbi:YacL family protein [Motilimonas cestriensis]|uniref:UPF0231 family protein n=1 Tax=Motilimonas cestriensis TaxID=2742685 RepID=UPI003DA5CED1
MEFEFKRDMLHNTIKSHFSMGHEALGVWLEQEINMDLACIFRLLNQIQLLQTQGVEQFELLGAEFSLFLNQEEAKVVANILLSDNDELPDDMSFYDEESLALCGLEDFEQVLISYQRFIQTGY